MDSTALRQYSARSRGEQDEGEDCTLPFKDGQVWHLILLSSPGPSKTTQTHEREREKHHLCEMKKLINIMQKTVKPTY